MSTTATRIRQISLVCVPTPDQDRAIEFYESLGFEKRTDIAVRRRLPLGRGLPAGGDDRHRAGAAARRQRGRARRRPASR